MVTPRPAYQDQFEMLRCTGVNMSKSERVSAANEGRLEMLHAESGVLQNKKAGKLGPANCFSPKATQRLNEQMCHRLSHPNSQSGSLFVISIIHSPRRSKKNFCCLSCEKGSRLTGRVHSSWLHPILITNPDSQIVSAVEITSRVPPCVQ